MVTVPYPSTADVQPALASETATTPVDAPGRPKSSVMILVTVIVAGLVGGAIVLWFAGRVLVFPAMSAARSQANMTKSANNMEVIAAAMLSYEADHGSFPPAFIADEDGKPMHSWRVLLLPYLGPGYDHVYEQYNFKEPWDGPNNMNLRHSMPPEYACPADPDASSNYETSYMVIVGDQTMFPGAASVTRSELTDGAAYTIMLAQSPASGICWMEPKDLDADGMRFEINGREGVEIASRHSGGAHVVTADGESHFLTDDAAPDTVEALTTVSGNEDIPWYAFE